MNNLNEDDDDASTRVHAFFRSIVAYDAKYEFLAGSYHCADNDRETTALHRFLGALTKHLTCPRQTYCDVRPARVSMAAGISISNSY